MYVCFTCILIAPLCLLLYFNMGQNYYNIDIIIIIDIIL